MLVFYGGGRPGVFAAEEPGQPRFQFFLGEELLRRNWGWRVVVNLAIEQELGRVDQHPGR